MNRGGLCCAVLVLVLTSSVCNDKQRKYLTDYQSYTFWGSPRFAAQIRQQLVPSHESPHGFHANAGSCEFKDNKTCGYTWPCEQQGWKPTGPGIEIQNRKETEFNISTHILQSPELNVTHPSCLSLHTTVKSPFNLNLLAGAENCTCVLKNGVQSGFREIGLPLNIRKILFQPTGGGTKGKVLIQSVSINPGCCLDDALGRSTFEAGSEDKRQCMWSRDGQREFPNQNDTVKLKPSNGTYTSPLISGTSSAGTYCLGFHYILPSQEKASLAVSIVDSQVWKVNSAQNSSAHPLQFGQLPVVSTSAFKVKFTADKTSGEIILQNLTFTRTAVNACSFLPPSAKVIPGSETDDDVDLALSVAIPAVVTALTVAIIAVVCLKRRRHKHLRCCDGSPIQRSTARRGGAKATARALSTYHYTEVDVMPYNHTANTVAIATPHSTVRGNNKTRNTAGQTNSSETYHHLGRHATVSSPQPSSGPKRLMTPVQDVYSRVRIHNESGLLGADGASAASQVANVYHEVDIDSMLPKESSQKGVASAEYSTLGRAPRALKVLDDTSGSAKMYDRVGKPKDAVYDVTKKGHRNDLIGSHYHHIDHCG